MKTVAEFEQERVRLGERLEYDLVLLEHQRVQLRYKYDRQKRQLEQAQKELELELEREQQNKTHEKKRKLADNSNRPGGSGDL